MEWKIGSEGLVFERGATTWIDHYRIQSGGQTNESYKCFEAGPFFC